LEKVPHFTQQASFVALFSEGHIGSPVSTTPPGECNAITNRSFGESLVDFVSQPEHVVPYSLSRACAIRNQESIRKKKANRQTLMKVDLTGVRKEGSNE
jgi:hypothetical protein